MRIIVLAVGRLRPPFADDVQHYQKLLAGHARLELIELREDAKVAGRIPDRAHVVLLDSGGRQLSSEDLATWLLEEAHAATVAGTPSLVRLKSMTR